MTEKVIELELQLGDVIQITNPVNEILNDQIFIIDYIDGQKVYLINSDSLNRIKLPISEDGVLGDGNITTIEILSRADSPSYARQNGLLPGKWVNIYFGGDFPVIITGEITNLEEDMIEIQTSDKDTLYINFDYKGIPEDLPIDNIEIREKPSAALLTTKEQAETEAEEQAEETQAIAPSEKEAAAFPEMFPMEREQRMVSADEIQLAVSTKDIRNQLREFIVRADKIVFGDEELGPIVQYVDVSTKSQRYSIETQVADLLDDLLSTVPSSQRTPRVLNNIHIVIERFKQLRELFSVFDQYGNVEGPLIKAATYKPLRKWLNDFNVNLYWILPVVKNVKKVYDVENIDEENNDMVNRDISEDVKVMHEILNMYQSNTLPAENNKYTALYTELEPFFRPFNSVDDESQSGIIIEKEVNANINTIINNLEDMYSSVFNNNMIRNRRFVITKYNLGQTKLDITDSTAGKMTTIRVPITKNDLMSVSSILTLPEPTIRFSKINLPGTDILSRVNLNQVFLNYWQLLKKKSNVNNTFIDSLDTEIEFDEATFVSGLRNYVLNISDEEMKGYGSRVDIYSQFTNIIVPKIRVIFNLMKKYINGKLSIVEVVSYLEPFLIYTDDLTFKQYQEIVQFIDAKISSYNRNMIEFSRIFKLLSTIRSAPIMPSKAFSVIEIMDAGLRDEVLNTSYGIENRDQHLTNSEILRRITTKDYSRLYTSTLALQNLKLMYPKDISDIFDVEKKQNDEKIKELESVDTCETITIAKMYTSIEQLEGDNDVVVYFDKKYDKTNYGVMEDNSGYAKEVATLDPERLRTHIINDQMKRNKLSELDATYLADTLIDGNKRVQDGNYAILYKGYSENIQDESDYYVRKNNKWVLDDKIKKSVMTDESSIICDLQEKCINVSSKLNEGVCESTEINELSLQNSLLTSVISEFDSKYKQSKEEFERQIRGEYEYFMSIMPILFKIETSALLKYNNERYKLGFKSEDEDATTGIVSPFAQLLDIILSQKDFTKKQNDILRFADKFTRPFIPGVSSNESGILENEHWLYCIKTGVPLLPSFKKELAAAFVKSQYSYQYQLEIVKSRIGQLSDDGDWWTDKYTGWPICPGDFDTEEGYDDGFKVSSRAIMEDDAGNKIAAPTAKTVKYITLEAVMINNIVNALSVAMGINIEQQKEFIINCVIETIKSTVESEKDYKDKVKIAAQKGKSLPSYRDFFNTSLLFYTLGMYLIAVQTMIPSVKTRKTHPGCVRSFSGYPFEGQGDLSSLSYLACITFDIRSSAEPWNVLKKTSADKIQSRIKAAIDSFLIQMPEVQRKFTEKTQYLLTAPPSEIPEEHDIANWSDFLPPLIPFKMKHLNNISEEFRKKLISDLRSGSITQREKLLVIESKIIQFSLAIQEKIQEIVKAHKVLLHTANNEPYLENSCCDSSESETVYDYFAQRSPEITEYNNIVKKLSNMLDDIRANTESVMFYSNINTKNIYPTISTNFDEKTVYLAFIFYCKFKSLIPIPELLLPLCTDKPESNLINPTDSIDRIIQKLKEDGRNYTNQQFLRLIQLISRENIVHIEMNNPIISCVAKLSKLIEAIYDENNEDELIEQSLRDLIVKAIDTFDIARETSTPAVKDLNNFLIRSNEAMVEELTDFVQKNSGATISRSSIRKFTDTLKYLALITYDDSTRNEDIKIANDAMYNMVNFNRVFLDNFINVFPNIVLNKVDYGNKKLPSYYGFSKTHVIKLEKGIAQYFEKLTPFYGVPTLYRILETVQRIGKNLLKLAESTPCFTSIKNGDKVLKGVINEETGRYLFQHYLLTALIAYVSLADRDDMIERETKTTMEVEDIFTVDYIDETETKVDVSIGRRLQTDNRILAGKKFQLKQKTAELLVAYMEIFRNEREIVDTTYEDVQDRIFKLKEREKDMVTDKLKALTDESRDLDTVFKMTKQGTYSKGLQKGLTVYDKDFYEDEQNLRDEMLKAERKIRAKNRDATDENIDILLDEYLDQSRAEAEIDMDAYDMSYMNETYYDGNTDGVGAPEEEYDDYADDY
jgi:hypothetical protein